MTTDFYTIAEIENLHVIETTSAMNGYPQDLKKALIGFDTYEQAEKVAEIYGLSIEYFTKRDGWQLYYRTGNHAYSAIEVSAEDYGDNYRSFTSSDYDGFYKNEVKDIVGNFENFDELDAFLETKRRIFEEIEDLEDDEMVITRDGEYYETIKCVTMSHYYDTKTTVIGVIGEIKESDSITKDDVLEMLSGPHMSGCYTAVRSTDAQGYNENYGATPVDSFFDEDSSDYLPDDNWTLTGFRIATPDCVDMDVWAQEFDENNKSALATSMQEGNLYVASFWNETRGGNDILIWES